jgi:hypothetical protein
MSIGNLAKLNRSSQNAVFAALIVIAAVALYNWIVAPQVGYLFAAQQYESAVGKTEEKNKIIAGEVKVKTKKLEELREQFTQAQDILFTPDGAKKFFADLQTISEETGCTVRSFNLNVSKPCPGDKRSKDTLGMVADSAILNVIGQYNSIIRLAEKLQNHPQKVWIDSLKIEILDFGSAQLKCDMTITIYTIQNKEAAL